MKKNLVYFVLMAIFIFGSSHKSFSEPIELRLSFGIDENKETQIEIGASAPVRYHCYNLEDPSLVVVDFLGDNVASTFDSEFILKKGPLKKITTFYLDEERMIDFLLLEFRYPNLFTDLEQNNVLAIRVDENMERQKEFNAALGQAKGKLEEDPQEIPLVVAEAIDAEEELEIQTEAPETEDVPKQDSSPQVGPEIEARTTVALGTLIDSRDDVKEAIEASLQKTEDSKLVAGALAASVYGIRGLIPILVYLFGSAAVVGWTAAWYAARDSKKAKKEIRVIHEKAEEQISIKEEQEETLARIERRRFPRVKVDKFSPRIRPRFRVETLNERGPRHICALKDVSLNGISFELGLRRHVPLIVQVEVTLPNKRPAEVCAKIVWQRHIDSKRKVYGALFLAIDQNDRRELESYLSECLDKDEK